MITKSKIICTLGPVTSEENKIKKLAKQGVDCVRLNFSHGNLAEKKELFYLVRSIIPEVAILCDIQGPKIRIGKVKNGGMSLAAGQIIYITSEDIVGSTKTLPTTYKLLPKEVEEKDLIFINDGIVCIEVQHVEGNKIRGKVLTGGFISSGKGMNIPSSNLSAKVPTQKDLADLEVIAKLEPEYVAVSFIQNELDIIEIKRILEDHGNNDIKIIAKIERPNAVKNFDKILSESDGIMIARGDLGVELPAEDVLPAQKDMIRKCNIAGKPVIVATQMLESMVRSPVPTRAEVSDVYNAIEDGADAVMLSAETATGDFPFKAVAVMENVIRTSEQLIPKRDPDEFDSLQQSISEIIGHLSYSAAAEFGESGIGPGTIICLTSTGYTARMVSKYRPPFPILGLTHRPRTQRELRLLWGVEPVLIPELQDISDTRARLEISINKCLREGLLHINDKVIIVGNLLNLKTRTNMLALVDVKDLASIKLP